MPPTRAIPLTCAFAFPSCHDHHALCFQELPHEALVLAKESGSVELPMGVTVASVHLNFHLNVKCDAKR